MKIRIWGVRGSIPSPLKPDEVKQKLYQSIFGMPDIDTSDPDMVWAYIDELPPLVRGTAGGNTACIEIQANGETLIIDAGSGIRELGLELMKGPCGQGQGNLHIFFSHLHWDHLQGFPLFLPAFVPGNQITFYSVHNLEAALTDQQRYQFFPVSINDGQAQQEFERLNESQRQQYKYIPFMQAKMEFRRIEVGVSFLIGGVTVNTINNHHPGDAYSYRFEDKYSSFVYASDAEYKDLDDDTMRSHLDFFKGADTLVFDAQYGLRESWESKVDFGHSSAMIGVDLARRAGVKKLVLFHHEPTYSDMQLQEIQSTAIAYQAQDSTLPACDVLVAYEGLMLDLTPIGAVGRKISSGGEATILTARSTFDELGVNQLTAHLAQLAEQKGPAGSVIDLSQVERLTTAGLKKLVTFSQQREGGPLVLAAPSREVYQVIRLGGYDDYFAVYETVEEAVAAVQARDALNLPGHTIDERYQIAEKLGEGRQGVVFKVIDTEAKREAALKILSPTFGVETIDHFARHAHFLLDLDHPNIVRVFDYDWSHEGDLIYIVEDLMTDPTLQERFGNSQQPISTDEALEITLDLTLALEHAHRRGILHGNLKPRDIFLTKEGVRINGFGLGYIEEGRNLLEAPKIFLSVSHLAPEQISGQPLDPRTDLYALGVILYQLFTGRLPFEGSEREVMQAHLEQPPIPPRQFNPNLSRTVEHLILRLLAKNPNDRYASAQQARRISTSLIFSPGDFSQPGRLNLVGRAEQLQTLKNGWDEVQTGRGQLAFITGEPGIGKTSLALELAAQSGASVMLLGHCQQKASSPAYHPFREALQAYFSTVTPELLDENTRQLIGNFGRLVPKLHQIIPDLPTPPPLDPKQEQLRLITSLTQFIKQATQEHSWLLILEDLHWADQSSIELLRYLGRHLPEMSLFIVGIYRDLDLDRNHPLRIAVRDLNLLPTCRHIPLERLSQAHVAEVLGNIWHQAVPEQLVKRIYACTGGNPLYLEEVARGLADEGLVVQHRGQSQLPEIDSIRLPQSVYDAVEGRIHFLDADTRDILSQAAIFGQTFRFDNLIAMSGLSEWDVLDHLDLALERQLVQEIPGEDTLRFRHAEIHHVIYNDLGTLRRRRLHRRAGDTLEKRAQPKPESIAEELAYHFGKANELERALIYSIEAARQAEAAYANETAVNWYRQTLEVLDQLDPAEAALFGSFRFSIIRSLGGLLQRVGQWDEAREVYQQGIVLAEKLDDRQALVWCQTDKGDLLRKQGYYADAAAVLQEAITAFEKLGDQVGVGQVLHYLGTLATQQGNLNEARACYEQSLAIRKKLDDQNNIANLLNDLAILARNQGDYQEARKLNEEALKLRYKLGDKWAIAKSLNNLGQMLTDLGEYEVARTQLEVAAELHREIGDRWGIASTLHTLANVVRDQGNYEEARPLYEESLIILLELGERWTLAYVLEDMGGLAALQGQPERALVLSGAAEELRDVTGTAPSAAERDLHEKILGPIRKKLGEAAEAAVATGRAMSLEEAVDYAFQTD